MKFKKSDCQPMDFSDEELRKLEEFMLSPGSYIPENPREVIFRLLSMVRRYSPRKRGRPRKIRTSP
jgi:uncharacterized protein with von Willebrand factor type A (vWA) domain